MADPMKMGTRSGWQVWILMDSWKSYPEPVSKAPLVSTVLAPLEVTAINTNVPPGKEFAMCSKRTRRKIENRRDRRVSQAGLGGAADECAA